MNVRTWTALSLAAVIALTAAGCGGKSETESSGDSGLEPNSSLGITLGYSEGLTEVDDPDALQKAVNAMYEAAAQEGVMVEYQGDAYSEDGSEFTCYLGNPTSSDKDVFLAIYGDSALTDELYLSQLIPPGQVMRSVTLNHPLNAGDHPCYVVYTQVVEENGEQVITGQSTVTVNFHVSQ